ncbi:MAG: RidA family protein [Devosia sp.]
MAHSFNPPGVWSPFGTFSQSVITGSGRLVFLKGQVALDAGGQVVGAGDMAAQVKQVLQNISDILASIGGRMTDVVSLNQFTTDIQSFMGCGEVRGSFFVESYPVTTTVEVSSLYDPRLLVEITATAEIPLVRFSMPHSAVQMCS